MHKMKPLALITGSTGFIGSKDALRMLEAGSRVRLVVRLAEQADGLRNLFAVYVDSLEFSIVPDLTLSGCYDYVLQDVEYVLHLASPLPSPGQSDLLGPAVKGIASVLQSATKVSSVKKVVITGSMLSLVPLGVVKDGIVVKGE